MAKRIKVDELLTFDAAPYLDSEEAIAAYLTESRVKLGSLLACMAREASGLTDEEHALFESGRIKSPARAASFE